MESDYRQERLLRWLLPSLILHLLILFALIMLEKDSILHHKPAPVIFENPSSPPPPIAQQSQPTQDDDEVLFALNQPKSSTFGATSLVSEELQFAGDPQAISTAQEKLPEETTPEEEQNQEEAPIEQQTETPPVPDQPTIEETHSPIGQDIVQEQRPPEPSQPPPKRKIKNFWGQARQSSSPISQKMSLTKLAEGFLDYSKETRGNSVDINSRDLNLEPTLQKIGWFLQNSFHAHNKPISLNQDVRTKTTLHLEMDADGSLLNCYLSPQTNTPALDRNLLRIAQGAAPFPPIPQRVMRNKKSFSVKIPIAIDAHRGTHEYYFVFRG